MLGAPAAAFVAFLVALASCASQRRAELPPPPHDPTRLPHERHASVGCAECHQSGAARPGADDHKPCDDARCHQRAFLAAPGPLCRACHRAVTTAPLRAPLKAYPVDDAWQALPPVFAHRRHLDSDLMERRVGFHVACVDCHTRDGVLVRPDHATCSRCHATEAALPKAPRMEECAACHRGASRPRVRARVITGDLHFDHDRHKTDRKGEVIRCESCHAASARSTSYADHAAPRIESCVACHDDSDRTPYQLRMRICEGCHTQKTASLTALAPRSHLPATERPLDHTLAFRRDHAEAAGRSATRCATCHTQMSGNPRQACDECHQRMVPADHRITFRELDHGAEAAADRSRCATCHVVEFCTACHAQRPRSHGFATSFFRDHGRLARINPRPCVTCHVEQFCLTSGCHASGLEERR